MKKLLVASVLALGVALASQQRASAWHEWHFGIGLNISGRGDWFNHCSYPCDSGGSCGWSLGCGSPCYPYNPFIAQMFPSYQGAPDYGHYAAAAAPAWQGPAPSAAPQAPASAGAEQAYSPYFNTGYQPVGYTYPGYSPYQAPSYWYGR